MTSTLRYPLQIEGTGSDYMLFQAHDYRSNRKFSGQTGTGGTDGPPAGSPIILYMPNSTPPVSAQNSWGSENFAGPLGEVMGDIGTAAAGGLVDLGGGSFDRQGFLDSFREQMEGIKEKGGTAVGQIALNEVGKKVGGSANNLLALSRGEIYNPNVELIYQGPTMRQFSFNFSFLPKSASESSTVNKIIKEFKKWSAPKDNGSMLEVPKLWSVKYMTEGGENDNMNKFKKCALLGVTIQANPTSNMHQTFSDGMPVVTSMQLSFQEVDIILREDHEEGGNQGF